MIEVTVTTEVGVAADTVFTYLADVTRNHEWQDGVESTEWTSSPPGEIGSTYKQTMEYRNQVARYRVTALEPGRSITVESVGKATIPTVVTRSVEERSTDGCFVHVTIVGHLRGLRRMTRGALEKMIRKTTEIDYTVLKRLLESAGSHDDPETEA